MTLTEIGNPDFAVEHRHMTMRVSRNRLNDSDVTRRKMRQHLRYGLETNPLKAAAIILGGQVVNQFYAPSFYRQTDKLSTAT